MRRGKYKKIVIFFSVLLTTIILFFIARIPPAEGYEISIYQVLPWYFWGLIITTYIWGISVCFKEIFREDKLDSFSLCAPIFTMIFSLSILFLMPLIRGYAAYGRGDVLSHIGAINDILYTGTFGGNWYPVLHVLGASFSDITGIDPKMVSLFFSYLFFLTYISGIFFLTREFFNKNIAVITLLIALIPLHRFFPLAPHTLAAYFLPFVMYIFVKSMRNKRFALIFGLIIFPFVIFHPLRSLFFLPILVIICLSINFAQKHDCLSQYELSRGVQLSYLPAIIWIVWYAMYDDAESTIRIIRNFLLTGIYSPAQEDYGQIVAEYAPPFSYLLRIGVFRYAILGMTIILPLIFILIFLTSFLKEKRYSFTQYIPNILIDDQFTTKYKWQNFLFIFLFIVFTILLFLFFIGGVPGGWQRHFIYITLFSTFLISFIYIKNGTDTKSFLNGKKTSQFLYIFLVILIVLSIFSFYRSPLRGDQNPHVTEMELSGMEWTLENRNETLFIEEIVGTSQHRLSHAVYRRMAVIENIRYKQDQIVSPHFGYEGNDTLGSQYENDKYLIISELSRIRYQELYPGWPEAQFFVEEDFEKLEEDRTVNKIYSNGEFDTYYISSEQEN